MEHIYFSCIKGVYIMHLFKKLLCLSLVSFSLLTSKTAEATAEGFVADPESFSGTFKGLTIRTVQAGDEAILTELYGKTTHKGVGAISGLANQLQRLAASNLFAWAIVSLEGGPIAAMQIGRQPTGTAYDKVEHAPLLQAFSAICGATYDLSGEGEKLKPENVTRTNNQGIASLMPVIPDDLDDTLAVHAIQAGVEMIKALAASHLLPLESTRPAVILAPADTSSRMPSLLARAGLTISDKPFWTKLYEWCGAVGLYALNDHVIDFAALETIE
jgi:hypothetical protein